MAKLDELIEHIRHSPRNVRFADACTVADAFFGEALQQGTSHRVWKMPWAGDPRVNIQQDKGGRAKAYQMQQLLKAIDRLHAEQAKKAEETKPPPKEEASETPRKKQRKRK